MKSRLILVAFGVVYGLAGFSLVVVGFGLSRYVPSFPVADAMTVTERALLEDEPGFNEEQAVSALREAHWYREVGLPVIVGSLLGLVPFPRRRDSVPIILMAGVSFALTWALLGGGLATETWIGVLGFTFCLAGGFRFSNSWKSRA